MDDGTLHLSMIVWVSFGVGLVAVAAVLVVWIEVCKLQQQKLCAFHFTCNRL